MNDRRTFASVFQHQIVGILLYLDALLGRRCTAGGGRNIHDTSVVNTEWIECFAEVLVANIPLPDGVAGLVTELSSGGSSSLPSLEQMVNFIGHKLTMPAMIYVSKAARDSLRAQQFLWIAIITFIIETFRIVRNDPPLIEQGVSHSSSSCNIDFGRSQMPDVLLPVMGYASSQITYISPYEEMFEASQMERIKTISLYCKTLLRTDPVQTHPFICRFVTFYSRLLQSLWNASGMGAYGESTVLVPLRTDRVIIRGGPADAASGPAQIADALATWGLGTHSYLEAVPHSLSLVNLLQITETHMNILQGQAGLGHWGSSTSPQPPVLNENGVSFVSSSLGGAQGTGNPYSNGGHGTSSFPFSLTVRDISKLCAPFNTFSLAPPLNRSLVSQVLGYHTRFLVPTLRILFVSLTWELHDIVRHAREDNRSKPAEIQALEQSAVCAPSRKNLEIVIRHLTMMPLMLGASKRVHQVALAEFITIAMMLGWLQGAPVHVSIHLHKFVITQYRYFGWAYARLNRRLKATNCTVSPFAFRLFLEGLLEFKRNTSMTHPELDVEASMLGVTLLQLNRTWSLSDNVNGPKRQGPLATSQRTNSELVLELILSYVLNDEPQSACSYTNLGLGAQAYLSLREYCAEEVRSRLLVDDLHTDLSSIEMSSAILDAIFNLQMPSLLHADLSKLFLRLYYLLTFNSSIGRLQFKDVSGAPVVRGGKSVKDFAQTAEIAARIYQQHCFLDETRARVGAVLLAPPEELAYIYNEGSVTAEQVFLAGHKVALTDKGPGQVADEMLEKGPPTVWTVFRRAVLARALLNSRKSAGLEALSNDSAIVKTLSTLTVPSRLRHNAAETYIEDIAQWVDPTEEYMYHGMLDQQGESPVAEKPVMTTNQSTKLIDRSRFAYGTRWCWWKAQGLNSDGDVRSVDPVQMSVGNNIFGTFDIDDILNLVHGGDDYWDSALSIRMTFIKLIERQWFTVRTQIRDEMALWDKGAADSWNAVRAQRIASEEERRKQDFINLLQMFLQHQILTDPIESYLRDHILGAYHNFRLTDTNDEAGPSSANASGESLVQPSSRLLRKVMATGKSPSITYAADYGKIQDPVMGLRHTSFTGLIDMPGVSKPKLMSMIRLGIMGPRLSNRTLAGRDSARSIMRLVSQIRWSIGLRLDRYRAIYDQARLRYHQQASAVINASSHFSAATQTSTLR